jgi:hypothetical protein
VPALPGWRAPYDLLPGKRLRYARTLLRAPAVPRVFRPFGELKKTSARPKAHSPITPQMMRSPAFPAGSLV